MFAWCPTGDMNARLEPTTTATRNPRPSTPSSAARLTATGVMIAAAETLAVSCVRSAVPRTTIASTR